MDNIQDPSNKRIIGAIEELQKVMAKEERGFIFAPMAKWEGDHKTLCAISFEDIPDIKKIAAFWATLVGLVENFQHQLPESLLEDYAYGAEKMVELMKQRCFPMWGAE